jgi:hypothetical protein
MSILLFQINFSYQLNVSDIYLAIDLTVTDPLLLLDFSRKVHDVLCGSDNFAIILENLNSTVRERPTG